MVESARVCQCLSGGAIMKLANTVTNITKNNKGFSLLEVLVGVSIIGIISAIAVPQFVSYRETASLTAADTSLKNMYKAYTLCIATKTGCSTKAALNIDCHGCSDPVLGTGSNDGDVCFALTTSVGDKEFRACLNRTTAGLVSKTYGGSFKFCVYTNGASTPVVRSTIEICDNQADCTNALTGQNPTTNNETAACPTISGSSAGKCTSGTAVCQ